MKEKHPCCAKCQQQDAEDCWVCKRKIDDDHIFCNNKFYHPKCMKCFVCGDLLQDRFLTYGDRPICEKDLKALSHVCVVCEDVITDQVNIHSGNYYCDKDFKALSSDDICSGCGLPTSPDTCLTVGDVMFHPVCLTCQVCHKNMQGKQISLDTKSRVYCAEDYARKFSPKCNLCHKAIVPKKGQTKAPRIKVMGKDFHLSCFKCQSCQMLLDSGVKGRECWPDGEMLLCHR